VSVNFLTIVNMFLPPVVSPARRGAQSPRLQEAGCARGLAAKDAIDAFAGKALPIGGRDWTHPMRRPTTTAARSYRNFVRSRSSRMEERAELHGNATSDWHDSSPNEVRERDLDNHGSGSSY
jgi:hypothetical protein